MPALRSRFSLKKAGRVKAGLSASAVRGAIVSVVCAGAVAGAGSRMVGRAARLAGLGVAGVAVAAGAGMVVCTGAAGGAVMFAGCPGRGAGFSAAGSGLAGFSGGVPCMWLAGAGGTASEADGVDRGRPCVCLPRRYLRMMTSSRSSCTSARRVRSSSCRVARSGSSCVSGVCQTGCAVSVGSSLWRGQIHQRMQAIRVSVKKLSLLLSSASRKAPGKMMSMESKNLATRDMVSS